MKFLFALSIIFSCFSLNAQDSLKPFPRKIKEPHVRFDSLSQTAITDSAPKVNGLVENKDEKIDLLIEDYLENKKYKGYRIQIFSSSNNKLDAIQAKSEFLKSFPDIKSYLVYQAPNFKVRVGDLLDRLQANKQLLLIQQTFPNAFLVKCEVDPNVKK
ncbi:SPOR domain-containing protein [Vicingaceae bacterium]|nr:SPOR domain-containing protein [Vicingaceae bacterium]